MKKPKWLTSLNGGGIGYAITLLLILTFIIWPIHKIGLGAYIVRLDDMVPFAHRFIESYSTRQEKALSTKWLERVSLVEEKDLPKVQWEEDTATSKGLNSLYVLDEFASDIRPILVAPWSEQTMRCKEQLLTSHFTDEYPWNPEGESRPSFDYHLTDTLATFHTTQKLDTWIYLPSRKKQPARYMVEFNFIPHSVMEETLQIGYATTSLANRFRYKLENNNTLLFDIIDHGYLSFTKVNDGWEKFQKSYSLPMHKTSKVRLIVYDDLSALYLNDKIAMAVRVKDYQPEPAYWYLLFWNGLVEERKSEMCLGLSNLVIYHPKK